MDPQTPASPTYRIFRDHHGIPQFEPKRGTQGLKDALIYAFPSLETELQLMQAALRKFFDSERGSTFVFELPERDLQTSLAKKRDIPISPAQTGKASLRSWKVSRASRTPSRPSSRASSRAPSRASSRCETPTPFQEMAAAVSGGTMTTWVLSNGQELEKRKRQPYDAVKRRKVAENRGNACEKHRASKTACNASECPQNKLYSKIAEQTRRDSESTAYDSPAANKMFQATDENTPAASEQPTSSDPSSLLDLDVFLDATDASVLGSVTQDSFLGLDLTTNCNSTTWTDNLDLGEMAWDSTSNFSPIQETAPNDYLMETSALQTINVGANPMHVLKERSYAQDTFSTPTLPALLEENIQMDDTSTSDSMALQQSLAAFNASDDPFMGWASKRASHLFDDYGWVLSHVEAL